jgi:hypothetical protein
MVKRLLLCWAVLGVLCGWTYMKPDQYHLQPVIDAMEFDGVNTTVTWETCGEINAYYDGAGKVIMCNELKVLPEGVIQFALAHELSHGVIEQKHIPFTGSEEIAADELASLVLHLEGNDEALIEASEFWYTMGRPEDPFDVHPSDMKRAVNLIRMSRGMESPYYIQVLRNWTILLGVK